MCAFPKKNNNNVIHNTYAHTFSTHEHTDRRFLFFLLPFALGALEFPVVLVLPVISNTTLIIFLALEWSLFWINHLDLRACTFRDPSCTWSGLRAAPGSCKNHKYVVLECCFNVICLNNVFPVCCCLVSRTATCLRQKKWWRNMLSCSTKCAHAGSFSPSHIVLWFNRQGDVYKQNTCGIQEIAHKN